MANPQPVLVKAEPKGVLVPERQLWAFMRGRDVSKDGCPIVGVIRPNVLKSEQIQGFMLGMSKEAWAGATLLVEPALREEAIATLSAKYPDFVPKICFSWNGSIFYPISEEFMTGKTHVRNEGLQLGAIRQRLQAVPRSGYVYYIGDASSMETVRMSLAAIAREQLNFKLMLWFNKSLLIQ